MDDAGAGLRGRQGRGCRSRRAAVPQQQLRRRPTFGLSLSDRLVEFDVAVFPSPTWRCVDSPGRISRRQRRCRLLPPVSAAVDDPQFGSPLSGRPNLPAMQAHGAATGPDGVDPLRSSAALAIATTSCLGTSAPDGSKSARPGGSSSRPLGICERSGAPGSPVSPASRVFRTGS